MSRKAVFRRSFSIGVFIKVAMAHFQAWVQCRLHHLLVEGESPTVPISLWERGSFQTLPRPHREFPASYWKRIRSVLRRPPGIIFWERRSIHGVFPPALIRELAAPGLPMSIRRKHVAMAAGSSFAIFVVLMMLGSSLAESAVAGPHLIDRAPYPGTNSFTNSAKSLGGCGQANLTFGPRAYTSTGNVRVSLSAGSHALCSGTYSITADGGFLGPSFTASTTSIHKISFHWEVSWNVTRTSGKGFTVISITLFGNLFDNTSGSWVLGGSTPTPAEQVVMKGPLYKGGSHLGVNRTFDVNFTASLTAGHHYLFYTGLATGVAGSLGFCGFPIRCTPGKYFVTVNLATGGDRAVVRSMRVS